MLSNLIVHGQSTAAGGTYQKVKINGEATVSGDIKCDEFICNGKARVRGSIKAKMIRVNGEVTFEGSVDSETLKVYGKLKIDHEANWKTATVYGQVTVNESIAVDAFTLRGDLSVAGDCEAELFHVKGAFRIDGLLNVGEAEIEPFGDCKAAEIGGEKIIVRKPNRSFVFMKLWKFFTPNDAEVITEMMEGDDLELQCANIKVVRANRVNLGQATKIDRVEYRDHLEKHDNAFVKETIQVAS